MRKVARRNDAAGGRSAGPTAAALDALAGAVEGALDRAAAAHPNPGRAPLHRMNRGEYANAIRDLLALEVDPATLLPADDSSNGFDNIADVLGRVAGAARTLRVGGGQDQPRSPSAIREIAPLDVTYTRQGRSAARPARSMVCRSARAAARSIRHNFPLDGEYLIKLSLTKLSFGQVFGEGAEDEELEVTLNGERVKLYQLDDVPMFFMREKPGAAAPTEPLTDPMKSGSKMTPDIHLEFRLKVKAGPQTIGVAFLQKSYDGERRPGASSAARARSMRTSACSTDTPRVPHLGARRYHRPLQRNRLRRHAQPPADFRLCRPDAAHGRRCRCAAPDSSRTWCGAPSAVPARARTSSP